MAAEVSLPKLSTDEHQLLMETLTSERDREMEIVNDHTSVQSVDRAKARSRAALLGHLIEKIK